jgi:hypothetical protein
MDRWCILSIFIAICILSHPAALAADEIKPFHALMDNGAWFYLAPEDLEEGKHHTRHAEIFGKYVTGTYNYAVLEGIDKVQASTNGGGGYFIGIKAIPTESPIGYPLSLFGLSLLDPPRTTSYCSGASYTAFIEGMNLIFPDGHKQITLDRFESLRMQEPDGGRREDEMKFWGKWNDDGYGSHYALVQYSGMGEEILPNQARPGDFMNISWTNGGGHSVVFLGWIQGEKPNSPGIAFWSSQPGTNGLGDVYSENSDRIAKVKIVRLVKPENIFTFDVHQTVQRKIPGDKIRPASKP